MLEASGPGRIELMKEGETDRCHIAVRVFDLDEAVVMLRACEKMGRKPSSKRRSHDMVTTIRAD